MGGGVAEGEEMAAGEVEVGGGLAGVTGGAWQPATRDKMTNPITMRGSFFMVSSSQRGWRIIAQERAKAESIRVICPFVLFVLKMSGRNKKSPAGLPLREVFCCPATF